MFAYRGSRTSPQGGPLVVASSTLPSHMTHAGHTQHAAATLCQQRNAAKSTAVNTIRHAYQSIDEGEVVLI